MSLELFIPEYVETVLNQLETNDIAAYIVGGSVRDTVLNIPVHDYDVCACTTPDVLEAALSNYRILETGKRYGTLTVISDGHPIEITCARRDGSYLDGRRPEDVDYTFDINEDLARRDFTVNAMAYNRKSGLIDLFGGMEDCENKIIRAVGEPVKRFNEDGLRLMRALRFSSVLGFKIEENTGKALHQCTKEGRLSGVSTERIYSELCGALCGENITEVLLEYPDVFCEVIPELGEGIGFEQHNPHHVYTVYEHIARTVGYVPADKVLRLTMLMHDIGKPRAYAEDKNGVGHFKGHNELCSEMSYEILTRLKADNATKALVSKLVRYHDTRPETKADMRHYAAEVSLECAKMLCVVRKADTMAQSPEYIGNIGKVEECEKYLELLEKEGACLSVGDLAITGADLIEAGFEKGPGIGETLSVLLDAVLDEKVENEKGSLLDYLKR